MKSGLILENNDIKKFSKNILMSMNHALSNLSTRGKLLLEKLIEKKKNDIK